MLNNVSLMGRLTRDPELRRTQNDIPVVSFSLAVGRPKYKNSEAVTDFVDIVAWRQTAEFVGNYFHKGQMMALDGRLQTRVYEDKEGNKRKAVEVLADHIYFADSKKDSGGNSGTKGEGSKALAGNTAQSDFTPDFGGDSFMPDFEDDGEVPF